MKLKDFQILPKYCRCIQGTSEDDMQHTRTILMTIHQKKKDCEKRRKSSEYFAFSHVLLNTKSSKKKLHLSHFRRSRSRQMSSCKTSLSHVITSIVILSHQQTETRSEFFTRFSFFSMVFHLPNHVVHISHRSRVKNELRRAH